MLFISKEDFYSHIYEEAVNTISRGDDSQLQTAIQAALNQAQRAMNRYDTQSIFSLENKEQKKPYTEIITYIKDIAKWHFIAVCNVQVDYEIAKERYKQAVAELDKIRKGENIPGWPLKTGENPPPFRTASSPKFNHH